MESQQLLTCSDLTRLFKISARTVARWCAAGVLPKPLRLGGSRRWTESSILSVIHSVPASAKTRRTPRS
jgi:predicted DNA-binding transcriptional regulator AlpA